MSGTQDRHPAKRLEVRTAEKRPHRRNESPTFLLQRSSDEETPSPGEAAETFPPLLPDSFCVFRDAPTNRFRDDTPRNVIPEPRRSPKPIPFRKVKRIAPPALRGIPAPAHGREPETNAGNKISARRMQEKRSARPLPEKSARADDRSRQPRDTTTYAGDPHRETGMKKRERTGGAKDCGQNAANGRRHGHPYPDGRMRQTTGSPCSPAASGDGTGQKDPLQSSDGHSLHFPPLPAMPRRHRYRTAQSAARSAQRSPSMAAETMPPA